MSRSLLFSSYTQDKDNLTSLKNKSYHAFQAVNMLPLSHRNWLTA